LTLKQDAEDATIATILTTDRLGRLSQTAQVWGGPISAAVYINPKQFSSEMTEIYKHWMGTPAMRRNVDIHLVYDDDVNSINWPDRPFPVNILRNVALDYVRSRYLIYLEADLLPNSDMYKSPELEQIK
jgi:hypothetical protein